MMQQAHQEVPCRSGVGTFFVPKRNGEARGVIDCRETNQQLHGLPITDLFSTSYFFDMDVDVDCEAYYGSFGRVFLASGAHTLSTVLAS